MTTFDQRERAFETKFVHEQDLNFRACAVRNNRIAFWTAEQLRTPSQARPRYAADIVRCGAAGGDEAVFQRLRSDLSAAGCSVSDHRLRRRMDIWLAEAMSAQYPNATQHDSAAGRPLATRASFNEDTPAFSLLRDYFSHTRQNVGDTQVRAVVAAAAFLSLTSGLILFGNTLSLSGPYDANLEYGSSAMALASVAAGVWARNRRS